MTMGRRVLLLAPDRALLTGRNSPVALLSKSRESPECRYHVLGEALEILQEEGRYRHENEVGHSGLAVAFYSVQALVLVADHDLLACFLRLLAAHRTDDPVSYTHLTLPTTERV